MKTLAALICTALLAPTLHAQQPSALDGNSRQLAHDVFKQLIEINTTDSVGSTTVAAEAILGFALQGHRKNHSITLGDLAIRSM